MQQLAYAIQNAVEYYQAHHILGWLTVAAILIGATGWTCYHGLRKQY